MTFLNLYSLTVILIIILTSCSQPPIHVRKAHKVMNSYTKIMKNEGFYHELSGGAMRGDIKEISLGYNICKNLNLEQARLFFLNYSELLLNQINSNGDIRPFLNQYPFTAKNIFLSLSFHEPSGEFAYEPNIAYIFINTNNEKIVYYIYNRNINKLECVYKEPYQDALRIYQESINCVSE